MTHDEKIERMEDEIERLQQRIERLKGLLEKYGQHDETCIRFDKHAPSYAADDCSCGLLAPSPAAPKEA